MQVALAAELGLPLFVHLRERDADKGDALGAYADALDILSRYIETVPPHRVCVHCFTGSEADLRKLATAGFMIGLTVRQPYSGTVCSRCDWALV
jgi:Tat protein secretion system quality control protein TatD with DNase activity